MRGWISMAEEALQRLAQIGNELRDIRALLENGAVTPQRYIQGIEPQPEGWEAQR